MGKKTKRFLIICAVVVGIGLILAAIGAAAGGVRGVEKLAERYEWISGPTENEQQILDSAQSFDSIKISGDMGLNIVKGNEDSVKLIYPKDSGTCDMKVENNTLIADYSYKEDGAVISLSDEDSGPCLVITRRDPASIKSIEANLGFGDVDLESITVDTVNLTLENGDVELSDTCIGTFKADVDYGDCELGGAFNGNITVNSNNGDIDIRTSLPESSYTISAKSNCGDIEAGGLKREAGGELQSGNGSCMMQLYTHYGDISVNCGSAAAHDADDNDHDYDHDHDHDNHDHD